MEAVSSNNPDQLERIHPSPTYLFPFVAAEHRPLEAQILGAAMDSVQSLGQQHGVRPCQAAVHSSATCTSEQSKEVGQGGAESDQRMLSSITHAAHNVLTAFTYAVIPA